jgi:peptide/nickel transport system substrate-binding protein
MSLEEVDPQVAQRLARDYTDRVHSNPAHNTWAVAMNTRVPPFDDVRVRRAVNYAIDRDHIADLFGGATLAKKTCQILPPNMPGYEPTCPYTIQSERDRWTGPDTGRAQALVTASGTAGKRVVVLEAPIFHGTGRYVVKVLDDLGFDAELRSVKDVGRYFGLISDSRTRAQIFGFGWIADYAVPSNFLDLLFSCDSYVPASPFNPNTTGLCDPSLDRMMERAQKLDVSNPPAARKLWAEIDRRVVDLAPWAPTVNLYSNDFVSERVGNYQYNPQWGVILSQLWVE